LVLLGRLSLLGRRGLSLSCIRRLIVVARRQGAREGDGACGQKNEKRIGSESFRHRVSFAGLLDAEIGESVIHEMFDFQPRSVVRWNARYN
jgi:hypothetical protein